MHWSTFVAVGDSFTEGLEDGPATDGHYVGWADRVAHHLAARGADLRYANLAVRGRLLDEVLVDLARAPALQDRRLWHHDRLHLSPAGHRRVAAAVLERLDVPVAHPDRGWWRTPLPPAAPRGRLARLADDLTWVAGHLLPWIGRRLRGTSSGAGRTGKRPRPARV